MSINEKMGTVLRLLRRNRRLSQEAVAAGAAIDRRYLSDLENGKRNPSVEAVASLASFFGLELSEFFLLIENRGITQAALKAAVEEEGYEASLVFESPDFADCILGTDPDGRVVYSRRLMVEHLMADGDLTDEDAEEYIDYNIVRALPYMGENAPVLVSRLTADCD